MVPEGGPGLKSVHELADGVSRIDRFRTVDELEEASRELAEKHRGFVEWRRIGESWEGRPITALIVGEGERSAFLYGSTHPNEPIGSMAIEHLASRLALSSELRKKIGYRFILAKAIDVDGARLNEGWFRGPFDLTALRGFSQMSILGMTERLLKEAEERTRSQKLRTLHDTVHSTLLQLNNDVMRGSNPRTIPIQSLVRIQLQSAIVCLRHLDSKSP